MAKHAGDSGNWNLDSAAPKPMTIKERVDTQLGVTSREVIQAMEAEEAFLRTVKPYNTKRFTDRRPIPSRTREAP
jgi:hypothetical protein